MHSYSHADEGASPDATLVNTGAPLGRLARLAVLCLLPLLVSAACAHRSASDSAPTSARDGFSRFHADVAPFDSGGECAIQPQPRGSDAHVVSVYFPNREMARSVVTLVRDDHGRLRQAHEARGIVTVTGLGRAPSARSVDSAFAAVQDTLRTTFISLDYRTRRVTAINRGARRPERRVQGDLEDAESSPALGRPGERMRMAATRCDDVR
jgi:hypothetical protein